MKTLRFTLPLLALLSLACDPPASEGQLRDRCAAACERVRDATTCSYDGCIATCNAPEIARCATELDAVLDCSAPLSVETLCGPERVCVPENAALGACLTASPDAGVPDAAR